MEAPKSYSFSTFIPEIVTRFSDRKALGFVGEDYITYDQMGKQIKAISAFVEALEINPGDRVVIYSQNMPNWGIVYFALQCMGIVTVPVLPDFNSHELENVLDHSEAKAIFVSEGLEYKLKEAKKSFIKHTIRLEDLSVLSGNDDTPIYDPKANYTSDYVAPEDELSILLYTSGTTGNSKGVMLSQKNVLINAYQSGMIQPIEKEDSFLSVLPLSHTYENTLGLILPIMCGAMVSYLRKPPTASVLMPALKLIKPTIMLTVPMIIEKVYRNSVLPTIKKNEIANRAETLFSLFKDNWPSFYSDFFSFDNKKGSNPCVPFNLLWSSSSSTF
jgi:long-chain acyl-CoA synthetase